MANIKRLIRYLLQSQGIDVSFSPVAKAPYEDRKVAFVHIAKCGGMSVDKGLRQAIAAPSQPRINRDATLAASLASFGGKIESQEDSVAFSQHHANNLTGIFEYYLAKQWQFVSGHVTVNKALLDQYAKDYAFVTVLRDPVERFISNYIYNKLTNKHQFMLPNMNTTDSLIAEAEQVLNSERGWQMANTQTMFLTGRYPKDENDAKCMQAEVARNLNQFSAVGFLDELDVFAKQCSQLTARTVSFERINTQASASKGKSKVREELTEFFNTAETKKKLSHLCRVEFKNIDNARN